MHSDKNRAISLGFLPFHLSFYRLVYRFLVVSITKKLVIELMDEIVPKTSV
jgi:hypothetical protein